MASSFRGSQAARTQAIKTAFIRAEITYGLAQRRRTLLNYRCGATARRAFALVTSAVVSHATPAEADPASPRRTAAREHNATATAQWRPRTHTGRAKAIVEDAVAAPIPPPYDID